MPEMNIRFPDEAPVFDGSALALRFVAEVDGEPVVCSVTAEALEDHFGARSVLEAELVGAFQRGRESIHRVCCDALEQTGGGGAALHSGLFRIERN
ncbi:DUF1488 domain-containing protein [Paraburkholderia sp. SUR17]|jgi:hypothetical protein|uniref:DUF1488 domain-containing protein n=1 Tax=Paraburkholderia sp. SUR17 TaxID=3034358 RepID=UPI0024079102|nr:DUF1488 domain-containing protein [Paraburkholderia sp. SUR17]WEY40745.1 DUF1488 domain-containing protein [Paraburkholderia sp. SUR17]